MSILKPPGALSQRFGTPVSAAMKYEPAGFYQGSTRFFWSQFPGSSFAYHYHPGEDWFGPLNTHLPAVEAGVVTQAGWASAATGYHVVVRIKEGTEYGYGHLNGKPPVVIGQHVTKGQTIGYMGRSGTATGIHTHFYLQIWEQLGGVYRTMLYNPSLFYAGGSMANDARIQPGYTAPPVGPKPPTTGFPRNLSFAPGTYTGVRFNGAGGIVASKPYTLSRASSAPASQRSQIKNQSGFWYYITAGIWASYWIKEGTGITAGSGSAPVPTVYKRAELNGNGINVRESAGRVGSYTLDAVYAVSVDGAVRRISDGADLGHWVRGDSDTATTAFTLFKRGAWHGIQPYPDQWAAVWCGNAYRAVARPLVTVS